MSENDEDILACFSTSDGVDERFLDVSVVHVQIAAKDTPENALECLQAGSVDGSRNEPVKNVSMEIGVIVQW